MTATIRIVDLAREQPERIEQTAFLLQEAFGGRPFASGTTPTIVKPSRT
jgi:hypothetical protein